MRLVGKKGITRRALLGGAFGLGLAAPQPGKRKPPKRGKKSKPARTAPEKPVPAVAAGQVMGPGPVLVRLRVNGRLQEAKLAPHTTLLAALRDSFGLTGAKDGCDRGLCGACTVLLDGKPVYACSVLAIDAQDRVIETVESLGRGERMPKLQASLAAYGGFRCGFCAPGIAMSAKVLFATSPSPSRGEIAQSLAGHLCLCGAYPGVVRAVEEAAAVRRQGQTESRG